MSLSIAWYEHEDALRIADSLGDEVEAYFGDEVDRLLGHRAFGESFKVACRMITGFTHSKREILSCTYITYTLSLNNVLQLLAVRRGVLHTIKRTLEDRLEMAIRDVLRPTPLSIFSPDLVRSALQCEPWDLREPIMIHYLDYVLARLDVETRLNPDFYPGELDAFEVYMLTTNTTQ